jgi:hypothetical protein
MLDSMCAARLIRALGGFLESNGGFPINTKSEQHVFLLTDVHLWYSIEYYLQNL